MNATTFHTSFISIFLIEPFFFFNNFFFRCLSFMLFRSDRFSIFLIVFFLLSLHTFDHCFLFFHFFLQFSWIFLPYHSLFYFLFFFYFLYFFHFRFFFIGHSTAVPFQSFPSFSLSFFFNIHSYSPLPSSLHFHLSILSYFYSIPLFYPHNKTCSAK